VSIPPPRLVFLVGNYPSRHSWVASRPYPLLIGQTMLAKKKHSSLFGLVVNDEEKSFPTLTSDQLSGRVSNARGPRQDHQRGQGLHHREGQVSIVTHSIFVSDTEVK
jgi:hypothetical protein